jgi:hypothetical protein
MSDPPAAGALVLRVERQDDYMLFTMVCELWSTEGSANGEAPAERSATADRDEVLRVVAAFLDRF